MIKFIFALLFTAICVFGSNACRQATDNPTAGAISVTDADGKTVAIADNSRVISIGTATTETVYALGAKDKLVAVDNPSREYIAESKDLPTVGGRTALNAEGILSLKPTLAILPADSAPAPIFDQMRAANIAVLTLMPNYTTETVKQKINTIARARRRRKRQKSV